MDWLATIAGISGAALNAYDVRLATAVWLTSNVAFLYWSIRKRERAIFTLNAVYFCINLMTLIIRICNGTG